MTHTDEGRLRYIAEHPGVLPFLYDMLGEVWVENETGTLSSGLLKDGHDPLDGIRELIDEEMDRDALDALIEDTKQR